MNRKAVRVIFVVVVALLLFVFFNSLPTRKSSTQLTFESWQESLTANPAKLGAVTVKLLLPQTEPTLTPLEYALVGSTDRKTQDQIARLLDLIKTANLISLGTSGANDATVIIRDPSVSFTLGINQDLAQKVPAAALLLRLLVEYQTTTAVAEQISPQSSSSSEPIDDVAVDAIATPIPAVTP